MRVVIFSFIVFISLSQGGFLAQQSTYERVRAAIDEKQIVVDEILKKEGLEKDNFNLLFMAFEEEKKLVLFAKKKGESVIRGWLDMMSGTHHACWGQNVKKAICKCPKGLPYRPI